MPISGQPIAETTVQHVNPYDMLDPYIAVQIKAFDQTLTERLDNTNIIINYLDGFGITDEGKDMPLWDTWEST